MLVPNCLSGIRLGTEQHMPQRLATLALVTPQPLTAHPAAVYLSQLSKGSQRVMRQSLDAIADILTQGQCDALTLDWSALRYQHTAALRAVLKERYAPATANRLLCATRRVLKEARRLELMSPEDCARAADVKNISASPPLMGRALDSSEIAAIMNACTSDPTPAGARDAATIAILRSTGLRRGEIVALNLADLDLKTGELQVRCGKGRKARTVYLSSKALPPVRDWLKIRGTEPGALLCPVHRLGAVTIRHMTSQTVLYTLQKRGKQAGIASFSPHDFRRTFCSNLLDAGVDVFTVQKLAGHASPVTTAKYDRRGEEAKKKAVEHLEIFYS